MKRIIKTNNIIFAVLIVLLIFVGFDIKLKLDQPRCAAEKLISANFTCAGGKSISSVFHNGKVNWVDLKLSDGRNIALPQALSASGARYASLNESFVFWNKGDIAFINESDSSTYTDCVAH